MPVRKTPFALSPRLIWVALLVLSVLLFFLYRQGQAQLLTQEEELRALSQEHYEISMQTEALRQTKAQVGTDRYIEQQARKQFGYMMSDEIRFVVTDAQPQTLSNAGISVSSTQEMMPQETAAALIQEAQATPVPLVSPAPQTTQAPQQTLAPTTGPVKEQTDWSNAFN